MDALSSMQQRSIYSLCHVNVAYFGVSAIRLSSSSKPQSNEARQNTYPESAVQPFNMS